MEKLHNKDRNFYFSRNFIQAVFLGTIALSLYSVTACYNYVCSDQYKTCTKKSGDNVYVNSNACASKLKKRLLLDFACGEASI